MDRVGPPGMQNPGGPADNDPKKNTQAQFKKAIEHMPQSAGLDRVSKPDDSALNSAKQKIKREPFGELPKHLETGRQNLLR